MANPKILLVDDSDDHRDLLKVLFDNEGYHLECAANGREALELLKAMQELPAFILLDLMMPVMDGYAFREEQLQDLRLASIPVVVMTADGNVANKTKKMGVGEFIHKPANVDHLLGTARRYCT